MTNRLRPRHAAIIAGISLLMTYTNCAQAPDDSTSTSSQSSFADGLPFAYQEKVDTIAYMSCSEMKDTPINPKAYFTFRVGAYQSCQAVPTYAGASCSSSAAASGLSMTTDFRKATSSYSTQDRARLFTGSMNGDTRLNLSIRLRANLQSMYRDSSSSTEGTNIDSFLPPLSNAEIAGPLAGTKEVGTQKSFINYFPGSGDKRLMEASLNFSKFENIMQTTRNNLAGANDAAYLVVGYSGSSDALDEHLRQPTYVGNVALSTMTAGAQATYAMGTGYALAFSTPDRYSGSAVTRVLSTTQTPQEINLSTKSAVASSWDCSTSYQFVIVRPQDVNLVVCRRGPDQTTGAAQVAQLAAIRRVLRVEDWYVDLDNRCVIPKTNADYCYGDTMKQAGRAIAYTTSACTNTGANVCPHFVSVCVRR